MQIGFVFLYFYGLERRILIDLRERKEARPEKLQILVEVDRLLSIYGDNDSFSRYASGFAHYLRCTLGQPLPALDPLQEGPGSGGRLPFGLLYNLGLLVQKGEPIPAEWALAWLRGAGRGSSRTPARRCPDLYRKLFALRYQERYGEGMVLKPNKSRLEIDYYPASGGIQRAASIRLDLPDVGRLNAPLLRLQEVSEGAVDDLDPYSRWLGRNPEGEESLPSLALLPADLVAAADLPQLDSFETEITELLGLEPCMLAGAKQLLSRWPTANSERTTKKEATGLATLLQAIGYGLEPDVRFGGPPLSTSMKAVVFRLPAAAQTAPSQSYTAAALLLHLAAAVAGADGSISVAEKEHLEMQLEETLGLEAGERIRLRAHLTWLLANQPGFKGLKSRLADLTSEEKRSLASFSLTVAGADGHIDPSEVKILNKIYRLLGLPPDSVYTDIHHLTSSAGPDEPVTVREGSPPAPGFRIPPAEPEEPEGFRLDPAKVAARIQETRETSRLLAEIFEEENPAGDPPTGPEQEGATLDQPASQASAPEELLAGLDASHSALLRSLHGRGSLSQAEFAALAEGLGLLPAGALDTLNEASFETCDLPILEGDDPLEVNDEALEEMVS